MTAATLLALAGTTLLAYAVKAATGFGPALVVVALGSVLVGPVHAVILAAFLDLASGAGLVWMVRRRIGRDPWIGPAATMAVGAVVGSLLLGAIPTAGLARLVGTGVVGFGLWMVAAPARSDPSPRPRSRSTPDNRPPNRNARRPTRDLIAEHAVAATGGLSGGIIGVGGPPLIIYYGSRLPKERFRALLAPILLAAAFFRAMTYTVSGLMTPEIRTLILVSLPTLPLGLYLGNHLFRRIPEQLFRRLIGLAVTLVGMRLIL